MAQYSADEFNGLERKYEPYTLTKEIDKKINLLYHFCILKCKSTGEADTRELATRKMLLNCPSLISIDNALRGVLVGKCTLDELLKTKGVLQ